MPLAFMASGASLLQLLLTPHAVGRDAISKETKDRTTLTGAPWRALPGIPRRAERPAHPVPGRRGGPWADDSRPRRPASGLWGKPA